MRQNNTVILPMDATHVPQVARLEVLCFSDPWPESSVRSELENPLSLWLVALEENQVIGYVGSQTVLGEADILNVAVAPDRRKSGVGRGLLEELEKRLAAQGVYSLSLEVRPSNGPVLSLYEKLGYRQVGRRPGYYHKPKEDALILRKEWNL